jgi:hypothetical protein
MPVLKRSELRELCGFEPPKDPLWSLTRYIPPGPVCARFIRSMGPIDMITGPAGSGKSVGSVFKSIRFHVAAMPVCRDGVIRGRLTVLRDNYRALYRTTLRTWFEFFPPDYHGSSFSGGQDRPAQHVLRLETLRDGKLTPVDLTADFFAVGDVAIEELLKGYETSSGWCNEGDLLHERVIPFLYSRTGRYPPRDMLPDGAVRPRVVAVDFNPPDVDHPIWQSGVRGTFDKNAAIEGESFLPSINFFQQPSGLSNEAENRAGKTREEYESEALTWGEQDRRRFVEGRPGYARDGKPVYEYEFDERTHVADGALAPIRGLPLHIGLDQGNQPAAVLFQIDSFGKVRIYAECAPGPGTGIERFAEMLVAVLMSERFQGLPPGKYGADPAGFYGADKEAGELSWAQAIGLALGHYVLPAPTNEISPRLEVVRLALGAGMLIDPSCRMLIGGFAAHYKYRKIRDGVVDRFDTVPHKNDYANPHDALQYGLLLVRGLAGTIHQAAKAGRAGNVVPITMASVAKADFNVWNV